jgi:hypothetical protein
MKLTALYKIPIVLEVFKYQICTFQEINHLHVVSIELMTCNKRRILERSDPEIEGKLR